MQTIGTTFARYAWDGLKDIWNPVHNLVAAIRYILARYGDIFAIDPPVRGYARGTGPGGLPEDILGTGRSGLLYRLHKGEKVLPAGQKIAHQGDVYQFLPGSVNLHVDPRSIKDVDDLIGLFKGLKSTSRQHGGMVKVKVAG